jgi:hypothetical protein
MTEVQQKFFDYFFKEHDLITLESDFHEVTAIFNESHIKLVERAFVAGRSKTTWEQFKKDNDIQP